jgi:hypothetical protein
MQLNLKYVIDTKGKKTDVQIPIKDWDKLFKAHQKLIDFKRMSIDLKEVIKEIDLVERGKRKPRTLKQFIRS